MARPIAIEAIRESALEVSVTIHGRTEPVTLDEANELVAELVNAIGRTCELCGGRCVYPSLSPYDCPECCGLGYI